MIEILGVKYISDKEASKRYGLSIAWFRLQRLKKTGPRFMKLQNKGRVLYSLEETDKWFQDRLISSQ